jgi:hypothetical protein
MIRLMCGSRSLAAAGVALPVNLAKVQKFWIREEDLDRAAADYRLRFLPDANIEEVGVVLYFPNRRKFYCLNFVHYGQRLLR